MAEIASDVPKSNQTILGLYVTPREAYEMWKADREGVTILDVRTLEEYVFVGHPEKARNVPLSFPVFKRVADVPTQAGAAGPPPGFKVKPNPDFVSAVQKVCAPTDKILVLCGSGGRAAMAVNTLAQAGFTNVYNVLNGFEGEMVTDRTSADFGKSMKNGWKDAGLPWGRNLDPDLMWENAR
ncbi:rhodanese-like domain-containing protein [Rhizobium leguminosarum]|uniref:rhodanese-like domain-containing protein n=1 Tax=Rhizobium leguminosarum TaxID=384 RepID=UPI0013F14A7C|nr:rhodanese-like domain-containing protein [Rhizobium leguminosarum]MBY5345058.1 sulfurtransferase [Rhizobium leguminosarum]